MKYTLKIDGPMVEMIEAIMAERGITAQEATRLVLGEAAVQFKARHPRIPQNLQNLQTLETLQILENLQNPGTPVATRVEESSSKSSPEEKKEEKQIQTCAAEGDLLLFPDLPSPAESPKEAAKKKRDAEREAEIAWRIREVWGSYLYARDAFFRDVSGVKRQSAPNLRLVRDDIRAALLLHDRDLLGPQDRDRWRAESPVRAAGIGIFYDPWCAGTHPQNDVRTGGRRYLEPWRPWRPQRGKGDPVTRFAELCFEQRDQEAAR